MTATSSGPTIPIQIAMVAEHGLRSTVGNFENWIAQFNQGVTQRLTDDPANNAHQVKELGHGVNNGMQFVLTAVKGIETRLTQIEAGFARASWTGTGDAAIKEKRYHVDVANFKAIQSLRVFDSDREKFIPWNDKLLNAMSRIHGGAREILKQLSQTWSRGANEIQEAGQLEKTIRI